MEENNLNTAWFSEHRDLFVRKVVNDFLRASEKIHLICQSFKGHSPFYTHLAALVGDQNDKGILWRLKDRCHLLWRDVDPDKEPEAFFFDWMVGALFHEAMKLKENAYMVERYAPSYAMALERASGDENNKKCKRFFEETVKDMGRGIDRIQCLFSGAAKRLLHIIRRERENGVLVRLLIEEMDMAQGLFMKDGAPLLSWLYPEGVHLAYLIAGESYLEGGWYSEARMAFEEALRIEPECYEAQNGLSILEKRIKDMVLYGPAHMVNERMLGRAQHSSGNI